MELFDFHYAQVLANQLYNTDMEPEDFEELGLLAFDRIGNKRSILHNSCVKVSSNNTITLPENCGRIEALTYNFEDANFDSPLHDYGDVDSVNIENNIEQTKELTSPQYISGRYVKYTQNGNTLYLKDDCRGKVLNLLYYENIVDDNDLPQITYKEALAIATYVAQVGMFKKAIATNNSALMQMSQSLERKTAYYIDQARVPDSISQNEMNEILDVKASYDRKVYGKSYKPIK